MREVFLYNTLTRNKQKFIPLKEGHVGMYVCGPTVYGDGHLGHARAAITFDIVFRYFKHIGYKVRYVRNITDVGHLTNEIGDGEDKIQNKAKLEQLEPMEVVKYYVDRYHKNMEQLNVLPPSIEPFASGHIIEQIDYVKEILNKGFAYEKNGSVYFDLEKYNLKYKYGILSGRVIEDLMVNSRDLNCQDEKNKNCDFALWKKADETHIMKWNSPWGSGFPGWHLECSAMGEKYLGKHFDIHGGGLDLLFPHHECEIAQSVAANGKESVNYWMHNNMITISGQKMGKSLNNFITINEFFEGSHKLLEKPYSPMAVRFFILQAQYRSTLDFSNEALQAAEKGMNRLFACYNTIETLTVSDKSTVDFKKIEQDCYTAMDDDFNTPIVISYLFEAAKLINCIKDGKESINLSDKNFLKDFFSKFLFFILGLKIENSSKGDNEKLKEVMKIILSIRAEVKKEKNFVLSDKIRDNLKTIGIDIKDGKDATEWSF